MSRGSLLSKRVSPGPRGRWARQDHAGEARPRRSACSRSAVALRGAAQLQELATEAPTALNSNHSDPKRHTRFLAGPLSASSRRERLRDPDRPL